MKFKLSKKTTAQILFAAAVVLLAANIALKKFFVKSTGTEVKPKITLEKIDSIFVASLHNYGISDDWIKERKTSRKQKVPYKSYKVLLPKDLSIPVVLTEIYSNFSGFDVRLSSKEKKPSGKSLLSILSDDEVKLKSEFVYNDTIKRKAGKVSFLITDFELESTEDSVLLRVPEPFSIVLIPSKENNRLAKKINKLNKSYSLLLNDDIDDLDYKLNESYSIKRLRASIKAIANDFSKAVFFIIDDESDIYNSTAYELIRKEFLIRKIKLVKKSSFTELSYDDEDELKNIFDEYIELLNEDEGKTFIVDEDGLRTILPEIRKFRKVGYKFVHPSEIMIK